MSDHEMKNAAYAALTEQGYLPTSKTDRMAVVSVVVDAVESLIRADEREYGAHTRQEGWLNTESHRKVVLAELRNKVESLLSHHPTELVDYQWNLAINTVLDLLDGDDDA